MWIAFKLYLWNIEISTKHPCIKPTTVVNCFQIVSLKYWNQQTVADTVTLSCCELLSNCIFEILKSAITYIINHLSQLWIAFKLYLWNIEISSDYKWLANDIVVNCFQIVSLKYWNQRLIQIWIMRFGCELLSNCIFEILKSALVTDNIKHDKLWIAFKLYLWNIEISYEIILNRHEWVVNCFQIVSLKYWNQQTWIQ